MALVILFFVPAVICDLTTDKIPNPIIASGYVTAFFYQGICSGYSGLWEGLMGALFPLIVLFPIFCIRGLGAGDLKLLSVAGCFFSFDKSVYCLIAAMIIGAALSIIKMLIQHNFKERLYYFISYMQEALLTGRLKKYNMETNDMRSRIHMSLPILLSALLCIGGFY